MVRAGGLVAGAALAGLVLAGCGGSGSDRGTTPSASTVTSASSSASIAAPSASPSYSVPPEARVQTEAGAVAFVTFYFEQVNKAWMTPDATLLPPLTDPTCTVCEGLQDVASGLVTNGHRYDGPPSSVRDVRVTPGAPTGEMFLDFTMGQNAARTIDGNGNTVKTHVEKSTPRKAAVRWEGDRWVLVAVA